jgi:hypothetical protein
MGLILVCPVLEHHVTFLDTSLDSVEMEILCCLYN